MCKTLHAKNAKKKMLRKESAKEGHHYRQCEEVGQSKSHISDLTSQISPSSIFPRLPSSITSMFLMSPCERSKRTSVFIE